MILLYLWGSNSMENNLIIKESPLYQEIIKFIKLKSKKCILENTIDLVSEHSYIEFLEWFKNSDLDFKYTKNAIDSTSRNCYLSVLDWFKNSDFKFKYTNWAIDCASHYDHISVLEFNLNIQLGQLIMHQRTVIYLC